MIEIIAAANCDDVIVSWRVEAKLKGCLGFALERQADRAAPEFLQTGMPFEGQQATQGETRPSSVWPIQRFVWADHLAPSNTRLRYRVGPVKGDPDDPQVVPESLRSPWTNWVTCTTANTAGLRMYPNRGIAAAPWVDRKLDALLKEPKNINKAASQVLVETIVTQGAELREALAGPVLPALRAELDTAAQNGEDLYVALYELRDDELIDMLISAGSRCHVILANGAFNAEDPDPNKTAAGRLHDAGIDLQRRMVGSGHFAHNKIVVFVDRSTSTPRRVWTGSTNWTPTGLCTQANHALVIEDEDVARGYYAYWRRLHDAESGYPKALLEGDATPVTTTPASTLHARAWCVPVIDYIDLADARTMIDGAKDGALFLMFRPGDTQTLVDDLKALHGRGLFIRGVVNTNFLGPNSRATIQFFNKAAYARHGDPELILPDHLRDQVADLDPEVGVRGVLIHSKTIVVDPFGVHPVVLTGSHNLGPKASRSNDDNLVIIEDAPGIASEFAVYIMNVYDQYKWRYERGLRARPARASSAKTHRPWNGLRHNDTWQNASYLRAAATEAAFWFGT